MEAALGVGQLVALEVLNPTTGKVSTHKPRGKWLGWSPSKRCFLVCTIVKRNPKKVGAAIERAHRKFHSAPSSSSFVVDVPDPVGPVKQVGLLKALVYHVPDSVRSPSKNKPLWHHAFGDTGHKGGDYSQKVMPALCRDSKGNLFIKRRKGNIFTVDDWLRG